MQPEGETLSAGLSGVVLWNWMATALPPAGWDPLHLAAHRFAAEPAWSLQVGQPVDELGTLEGRLAVELGWALGALLHELVEGVEIEHPHVLSRGQTALLNALVPLIALADEHCDRGVRAELEVRGPFVGLVLGDMALVQVCVVGEPCQREPLTEALQLAMGWLRNAAGALHKVLSAAELLALRKVMDDAEVEAEVNPVHAQPPRALAIAALAAEG